MTMFKSMPWKRLSHRYRIGALFALMLMLPGLTGCMFSIPAPRYTVPGVGGEVVGDLQTGSDGRRYYGIETVVNGRLHQRVVYEGRREYALIDAYFRELRKPGHPANDRSSIPGGAGTPPPPAVQ